MRFANVAIYVGSEFRHPQFGLRRFTPCIRQSCRSTVLTISQSGVTRPNSGTPTLIRQAQIWKDPSHTKVDFTDVSRCQHHSSRHTKNRRCYLGKPDFQCAVWPMLTKQSAFQVQSHVRWRHRYAMSKGICDLSVHPRSVCISTISLCQDCVHHPDLEASPTSRTRPPIATVAHGQPSSDTG